MNSEFQSCFTYQLYDFKLDLDKAQPSVPHFSHLKNDILCVCAYIYDKEQSLPCFMCSIHFSDYLYQPEKFSLNSYF